jgi:hypothetical protein
MRVRQSVNHQRYLRPTAILAPRVFRFGSKNRRVDPTPTRNLL